MIPFIVELSLFIENNSNNDEKDENNGQSKIIKKIGPKMSEIIANNYNPNNDFNVRVISMFNDILERFLYEFKFTNNFEHFIVSIKS